jgi:hypothetical protein
LHPQAVNKVIMMSIKTMAAAAFVLQAASGVYAGKYHLC